jgi:hypothetical protein
VGLWEYRKIALNQLSAKTADVDLLNDAGEEGWELVAILPNNIAYLKREIGEAVSVTADLDAEQAAHREGDVRRCRVSGPDEPARGPLDFLSRHSDRNTAAPALT